MTGVHRILQHEQPPHVVLQRTVNALVFEFVLSPWISLKGSQQEGIISSSKGRLQ